MDEINRRGRNLSVLSFGIIVFVLAGGEMNADGALTFLGGSFKLSNIYVFKAAILIVFFYYWYRLTILVKPIKVFKNNFQTFASSFTPLRNYVSKTSHGFIENRLPRTYRSLLDEENDTYHTYDKGVLKFDPNRYEKCISTGWNPTVMIQLVDHDNLDIDGPIIEMSVNWWKHKYYLIRVLAKLIRSDRFLEKLLPHLLAVIALFLIFVRLDMHLHLKALFLRLINYL